MYFLRTLSFLLIVGFPTALYGNNTQNYAQKCIALTFDDGPDKILTPQLLTILRQENVRATFFLVGSRVVHSSTIVSTMYQDGHEIGNHSWSHPNFTHLSLGALRDQIEKTDRVISNITGVVPRIIRPPYGATNTSVSRELHQKSVLWDIDTLDWLHRSSASIIKSVMSNIHENAIVLMHDIHPTTIKTIPRLIQELRAMGYTLTTVSGLEDDRCTHVSRPKMPHKP